MLVLIAYHVPQVIYEKITFSQTSVKRGALIWDVCGERLQNANHYPRHVVVLFRSIQHWTDEDHGTVVMRTYLAGIRKVFAGWRPNPTVKTSPLRLREALEKVRIRDQTT